MSLEAKVLQAAYLCFLVVHATGKLRSPGRDLQDCSIKIGLINQENLQTEKAVDLWFGPVDDNGGIDVDGTKIPVEVIKCSTTSSDEAAACARKLIEEDKVVGIIGPSYSSQAIPAGQVANDNETPLISGTSTNPQTTKDRPYVFRAIFLDSQQAKALAKFVSEDLGFTKACIIYDEADPYSKGLAGYFLEEWEAIQGEGSVLSNQAFTPPVDDFEDQVTACADTDAEFLFVPLFVDDVTTIANELKVSMSNLVLVGSDAFGNFDALRKCGDACAGMYASEAFHHDDPVAAEYVQLFNSTYGVLPDSSGILDYDAATLVEQALGECAQITCENLAADRKCLRDAMASIEFSGVGGNITFDENGDPQDKCVTIRQVSDELTHKFVKRVCPDDIAADPETADKNLDY